MDFGTASSRSWSLPAATCARYLNGLVTIALPSPSPGTADSSKTARTQPWIALMRYWHRRPRGESGARSRSRYPPEIDLLRILVGPRWMPEVVRQVPSVDLAACTSSRRVAAASDVRARAIDPAKDSASKSSRSSNGRPCTHRSSRPQDHGPGTTRFVQQSPKPQLTSSDSARPQLSSQLRRLGGQDLG